MNAEDVLLRAAEMIEQPGRWCQGALMRNESACMAGWIDLVSIKALPEVADAAIAAVANEIGGRDAGDIARWNDTPGRTAVEVAATCRNSKRWLVPA